MITLVFFRPFYHHCLRLGEFCFLFYCTSAKHKFKRIQGRAKYRVKKTMGKINMYTVSLPVYHGEFSGFPVGIGKSLLWSIQLSQCIMESFLVLQWALGSPCYGAYSSDSVSWRVFWFYSGHWEVLDMEHTALTVYHGEFSGFTVGIGKSLIWSIQL